jgi:uridylate kinase
MDKQAFAICAKKKIPIVVCRWQKGNVIKVVKGKPVGTEVTV